MTPLFPAIWLIVLIIGLPQLSETVYTPSLPAIASALHTSEASVEYTLTIYLFGFAIGTLFWGKVSDRIGRKPSVIVGLVIFIIGCLGCYLSPSIEALMISRWVQAFGGSIGSVLGQAICRDSFHGPMLGKVYSATGSALALFPALGPVCGAMIAEHVGWSNIFIFLMLFALILIFCVLFRLPETHPHAVRKKVSVMSVVRHLATDRRAIGFGLIVAGCNGILFSYFAEGSFYLINGLHLAPTTYGFSFVMLAFTTMLGGIFSRRLHHSHTSKEIMVYGLWIIMMATTLFSSIAIIHYSVWSLPPLTMIIVTLLSQMSIAFGICMATSNALALALVDYKYAIGTASSLFGFFYYCFISAFTFLMGFLHNGTLLPMPLYFCSLSSLMLIIHYLCTRD